MFEILYIYACGFSLTFLVSRAAFHFSFEDQLNAPAWALIFDIRYSISNSYYWLFGVLFISVSLERTATFLYSAQLNAPPQKQGLLLPHTRRHIFSLRYSSQQFSRGLSNNRNFFFCMFDGWKNSFNGS